MDVRSTIETTIKQVAAENSIALPVVSDSVKLLETGLDSLCLAVIVARLEDELGVDPFNTSDDMAYPITIGDFIAIYQHALA